MTKSELVVTSLFETIRLLNRQNTKGGLTMKSLIFFAGVFFMTSCSYQHAKSLDDRMESCQVGYQMALRSGNHDLTENVIFQIVIKRMNGYLEDTKRLEAELSQLILVSEDESTRKKAELALYFLTGMNTFNIAKIRTEYYDENKLFHMLEKYFDDRTPEYTQVK